jgi:hypothetical protein
MAEILPFQDGDPLPGDDHGSTEILESSGTVESATNKVSAHTREVFMVRGRLPLRAPTPPDINSDDEGPSAISPDALEDPNETEAEKTVRKKNKQRAGLHIRAECRRQALADYQTQMVEYDRQRLAGKLKMTNVMRTKGAVASATSMKIR